MAVKWLEKDRKHKKSKRQERKLARSLNKICLEGKSNTARVQAGSGSLWGNKGDVRTKLHLLECKRTDKASIVLKEVWLNKIRKEALKDGRIPALAVEIGNKRYVIVEECYLEDIL